MEPHRAGQPAERIRFVAIAGGGNDSRLGESFAELEGLLILATIASTVHLRLVDGQMIRPEPVMTLRPDGPVRMIVQRIAIPEQVSAH